MKTLKINLLLISMALVSFCFQATGQVTIGADLEPLSGVLLDIKTHAANGSNETTSGTTGGGLGLPRVSLTDVNSLAPFLPSADASAKTARTGLTVYNLAITNGFKKGIYVWDGAKWTAAGGGGGGKYFYLPACVVPITASPVTQTFNLHTAYSGQFGGTNGLFASSNAGLTSVPAPNDVLYTANQLDYVLTYYDTDVIYNGGSYAAPSIDANGVLTYSVKDVSAISTKTFFTVVLVVNGN
ncbi:MAG: hypothetical protein LBI58_00225 [Tannerellaceae bacterium]|jgi:hypothetical protein|nr:hypothetical protein [Tannerellaceae bacterium]